MNCYDCQHAGRTTPAVAVCVSCGAALCAECVRIESEEHDRTVTLGNPTHHRTRALMCTACDNALRPAAAAIT
jgi:hypothetical protein